MYYQLNGLTMRLADKERKITEFDKQIKALNSEYDFTKTKIATEKEKLDKATAKNKELRQMLNYVMQTQLNEEGDANKPSQLRRVLEYKSKRRTSVAAK